MKKFFLSLIFFLLIASPAWGATYTIGSGADDYTTYALFRAVHTEVAGDIVSFRKGDTFRETVTAPTSGTLGNVIKYTAHGTGVNPIISGFDAYTTGWTALAPSGSITPGNKRFSIASGIAFVDFSSAGILTPYIGAKLTITDSASKKLIGYIKAAGTEETYASTGGPLNDGELINDPNMAGDGTAYTISGATIAFDGADNEMDMVLTPDTQYFRQTVTAYIVEGGLYKCTVTINKYTDGNSKQSFQGISKTTWLDSTVTDVLYATDILGAGSVTRHSFSGRGAAEVFTGSVNFMSSKQVITPSATGVTISSTSGGDNGWTSEEAGFNRNSTSDYTYTIEPVNVYYRAFTLPTSSGDQEGEKTVVKYGATILGWADGTYQTLALNKWDYEAVGGNLYINIGANPEGQTVEAVTRQACITATTKAYLTFENLTLVGGTHSANFLTLCSNITFTDLDISQFAMYGVRTSGTYYTITRVYAHQDIGYDPGGGIGISSAFSIYGGNNHLITDCKGYNSRRGMELGQYAAPSDQSGTVVDGGEFYDNIYDPADADGIGVFGDCNASPAVRPIIRNVKAYGNEDHGIDLVFGILWDVYSCEMYGQIGSAGGGQGNKGGGCAAGDGSRNRWYYNLSHDNANDGFYDDGKGNEYYNNTAVNNGRDGFYLRFSDGNLTIKNNIAHNNGNGAAHLDTTDAGAGTWDYNDWSKGTGTYLITLGASTTYTDWATYQTATATSCGGGQCDANSISSDPLFVSATDFHLQAGSPAINAGVDVGLTVDYEGKPIPATGPVDIGAYQHGHLGHGMTPGMGMNP